MSQEKQRQSDVLGTFSVRNRLVLIIILAVIVPVTITQMISLTTTQASLTDQLHDNLSTLTFTEAEAIGEILLAQIDLMTVIADSEELEEILEGANESYEGTTSEILRNIETQDQLWRDTVDSNGQFSLIDEVLENPISEGLGEFTENFPAHTEVFVTDQYGANVAASNVTSDYYQGDENWWQAAWNNGEGAVYIADTPEFDESSNTLSVNMAIPIEVNDIPVGVLRSTFDIRRVGESLESFRVGESGRSLIANADGDILIADEALIDNISLSSSLFTTSNTGDFQRLTSNDGTALVVEISPVTTLVDAPFVDTLGWYIVLLENEAEVLAPINDALNSIVLPLVVVIALAVIIAFLVARSFSQPLQNMAATASRLGRERDWSIRVPVRGSDEFGVLGNAFNTMAEQIEDLVGSLEGRVQERTRDLQAVADVNAQISTILDVERLLQDVVDLTKERFGLYHAHIYTLNDTRDTLVLTAGAGHVGRQMVSENRTIDWNNRDSIVATSARNRQGVIINDVTKSATFLPHPSLPDTRSELAVPLIARGQVLGVLDVQSATVDNFDSATLAVIELLAGQIATALSNAQLFETSERTSRHEAALGAIDQKIQSALDMDDLLKTAVRELGKALRVPHTAIELQLTRENAAETSTNGHNLMEENHA